MPQNDVKVLERTQLNIHGEYFLGELPDNISFCYYDKEYKTIVHPAYNILALNILHGRKAPVLEIETGKTIRVPWNAKVIVSAIL